MKVVYLVDGVEVDSATYSREFIRRGGPERFEAALAGMRLDKERRDRERDAQRDADERADDA